MDYATYASAQNTARQIYDHKLAREGGPRFARVKELDRRAQGQVSNNYLHFENIRQAALGSPAEIDRDELLRIWSALPEDQRLRITTASMRGFFRAVSGVKLDIAELRTRAQQELCALHAGVGSAPGTGAGAGGVHQPGSGEDCRVPEHGDEMAADEWDASNSSNDPARIEPSCPAGRNAGCWELAAEGRNPPPPPLPPPAAAVASTDQAAAAAVSTPQQQHAHGHAPPPPPQPTDHAQAACACRPRRLRSRQRRELSRRRPGVP